MEIIEIQSSEMEMMQNWLKNWYGITYAPSASQEPHSMDMLTNLKGSDFEKQFLMMMIAHHGEAVNMAVTAIAYGFHPDLIELANDIILTQTSEIIEMRMMLREWYCITKLTPKADDVMRMHQMMDEVMNGEMHMR